jgi:hypothetical protein
LNIAEALYNPFDEWAMKKRLRRDEVIGLRGVLSNFIEPYFLVM